MVRVWFLFVALLSAAVAQNSELFELNIVHYNDFHAHFEEVSPQGTVCNPTEAACIGGYARLYTGVMQALEAEPDSLLLNGGDTFQGTIWYNFLRWNVSLHFMNMLPHDAHVLGNHEFDHDIPGLVPYLEGLNAPMLGANVNATLEPRMQGLYQNHTIIERHGRRIGIIGILLRQRLFDHTGDPRAGSFLGQRISIAVQRGNVACILGTMPTAPIGNLIMEDELTAVNREAAILTDLGVDIIVVLSHCGLDCDKRIAEQASSDVDIIVGGHSHTLLYTGETPNGDTPVDEYPTVVTQANGHRIPIVQASCYTRYLGIIKFFIDDAGKVQGWEGQPIYLGTSIIPDARISELLQPWREEVDAVGKEVLGRTLVTLNRSWCTSGECNMGSWACDGFLDEMIQRAQGTAWNYAHVCLINSGGLRVQINPGEISTESLLMAMPFENYVQVYDLSGEHLLEALEFSVGTFQATPGAFSSGRMLQVGGLRVVYNATSAVGSRVQSALIRCIDCDVPIYEPLDVNKTYKIITQNYIGDGGGGYTVLSENRRNLETLEVDYYLMQNYMRRQGTIIPDLDGRIQVVF